eukprot:m.194488 g.194488  ORF g.194488 m.194488 type:complete len:70 (+) comp32531_c0_seq1:3392-3601(+)
MENVYDLECVCVSMHTQTVGTHAHNHTKSYGVGYFNPAHETQNNTANNNINNDDRVATPPTVVPSQVIS